MKYIGIFCTAAIVFLSLFSCTESAITQINRQVRTKSDSGTGDATGDRTVEQYSSEKLALLFFEQHEIFPPRRVTPPPSNSQPGKPVKVKKHYNITYIADWVMDGKRYVKFRDMDRGVEYVIPEARKEGHIVILERSLFFYTIKIDDDIIEVPR